MVVIPVLEYFLCVMCVMHFICFLLVFTRNWVLLVPCFMAEETKVRSFSEQFEFAQLANAELRFQARHSNHRVYPPTSALTGWILLICNCNRLSQLIPLPRECLSPVLWGLFGSHSQLFLDNYIHRCLPLGKIFQQLAIPSNPKELHNLLFFSLRPWHGDWQRGSAQCVHLAQIIEQRMR